MVSNVNVSPVYAWTYNSTKKIKVHEGGTSSGKTVSLLQYLHTEAFRPENNGKLFSVARLTTPNLKRGPINDWETIVIPSFDSESFWTHNKTDKTWTNNLTGVRIEFIAFDNEQKGRGPRRHRLFLNEAQEIPYAIVRQLIRRTKDEVLIDYNPSLLTWWIDTEILTRDDVDIFYSTFKHNPFLSKTERAEIEEDVPVYEEANGKQVKDWLLTYSGTGTLIKGDPFEWGVYGLGRRGSPSEAIYPYVTTGDFPDGEFIRGLDFGFEHPSVLLDVLRVDVEPKPKAHFREVIFRSGLTITDLMALMESKGLDKRVKIIADSSRPEAIKEMNDAGWNVVATAKGAGSVIEGIDYVKRHELVFTPDSESSRVQFQNYRRKKIAGIIQDEPVKKEDDAPDAGRYGLFEHWGKTNPSWGIW